MRARGRKRNQTSTAITRSARSNGAKGGAPRSRLPDELLAELGEPPADELLKTAWWGRLLELIQVGVIGGRRWVGLMRDARRNARTIARLMPEVIKARAAAIVLADSKPQRSR